MKRFRHSWHEWGTFVLITLGCAMISRVATHDALAQSIGNAPASGLNGPGGALNPGATAGYGGGGGNTAAAGGGGGGAGGGGGSVTANVIAFGENQPQSTVSATGVGGWSTNTTPNTGYAAVLYSGTQWVALPVVGGVSGSDIDTSPDGLTWTTRTLPTIGPSGCQWASLGFNGATYLAVSGGGGGFATTATSTDTISWTAHAGLSLACPSEGNNIATNGSLFCLGPGSGDHNSYTSTTGATWTAHAITIPGTNAWGQLLFNGSIFLAVNAVEDTALRSTDCTTWTTPAMPSNGGGYLPLAWNGTVWAAVTIGSSSNAGSVATSTDGTTWTLHTGAVSATPVWSAMTARGNTFILVAEDNGSGGATNAVETSTDGVTWVSGTLSVSDAWTFIAGHP